MKFSLQILAGGRFEKNIDVGVSQECCTNNPLVQAGQKMIMTYRGKPILRLEPILDDRIDEDDPFYKLTLLAEEAREDLSNQDPDKILYES